MNGWTNEDVEAILAQLNERELPFKKYAIMIEGGRLCLLGSGSSSRVYRAERRKGRKKGYAIKVIGFGSQQAESGSFFQTVEAQQVIGVFENNVVKIYDFTEILVWIENDHTVVKAQKLDPFEEAETEGNVLRLQFIVMEEAVPVVVSDGPGKARLMPRKLKSFDEGEILKLARDIGTALSLAHRKQMIHRDVKLENIFYKSKGEHYKLGDFGIAGTMEDGFACTVAFTKGYGAPEVVGTLGDKYDCTADIYSFGMLLYVLLNGLRFPGSDNYRPSEMQYVKGFVPEPPASGSDELCRIVLKMIRFDPDERYQSMDEVLNELEKIKYGARIKYRREHREILLVLGVAFSLMGALLWGLSLRQDIPPFHDFKWAAVLLLTLAVVLLYYHLILEYRGEKLARICLGRNFYWLAAIFFYVIIALFGMTFNMNAENLFVTEAEMEAAEQLRSCGLEKVGICGALFCLLWLIREWLLIRKSSRSRENI